jgi:hypothetical protein
MVVMINEITYNKIVNFLSEFQGLSIECEDEASKCFPDIPPQTIKSIISKQGQNSLKTFFFKNTKRADLILAEYDKRAINDRAIVSIAVEMKVPPLAVCRLILNEKFSKSEVKEMLRDPDLIPDPMLSANVL